MVESLKTPIREIKDPLDIEIANRYFFAFEHLQEVRERLARGEIISGPELVNFRQSNRVS